MIWPPIRYSYDTHNLDLPTPAPSPPTWLLTEEQCKPVVEKKRLDRLPRSRIQLARHRRSGPRRGGAADLRLPHLGAVRADPDHHLVGHRRRRRRGAGLFRRLDRSAVPALHRNLDLGAVALPAADHLVGAGAGLLRAARHPAAVLLGVAGRPGARGIPARAQFRIYPGRARARRVERARSCSGTCCRTRWSRP